MSLYHEAAGLLSAPTTHGGSLKSRIFGNKELKSPPAQVYALVLETRKWSVVLKEVVENAQLLSAERKLTPPLALLLTHDLLLAKSGIALPASHGLRAAVERHKGRLTSELSRARLRRKCATVEALRALVETEALTAGGRTPHPRWVRVNALKSTVDDQLEKTFKGYEVVAGVEEVMASGGGKVLCLDGNVPNLLALPPGTDVTRSEAYRKGEVILQDKASCFPACLLDPRPGEGDVVDACAAPGNKTTHLAGILEGRGREEGERIFAFEKDKGRAKTLEKMVKIAGSDGFTVVHQGQDFLKVDPNSEKYAKVGALLLDPSCSGSGIVGRDDLPELHLPEGPAAGGTAAGKKGDKKDRKRKRENKDGSGEKPPVVLVDDDGETTILSSEKDLKTRIEALAAFQLTLLLHAFAFPAARKITYSTCSVYAGENEHVVLKALASDIARQCGWKVLRREKQTRGMREWPVRGDPDACDGDTDVAEACIRTYRDDGRGVMGFFVAGFVREEASTTEDDLGPYVRDAEGVIIRDEMGIPTLKATGEKAIDLNELETDSDDKSTEIYIGPPEGGDDEGPYVRDAEGRIIRDAMGMPTLKATLQTAKDKNDADDEWGGFDD
ncbi:S-adenosyl-L-methionine-dependent methyltransferase [Podospora aff. communis PSN243]|uniref:S-adenosyl-L-methionine-dependent methyltransferase n=1 Tax=Podospora aff. communis PSN243 TaxID=3040156 RepID=A0AAV9H956_9PEZI|nr:S-adenosyl-L-methionine-dependent methyltransferase [Podospora aff. communis PSN243]